MISNFLFQAQFIIGITIFYFCIFLLFKWLRSLFANETAMRNKVLNGMIIAEYILLILIIVLHLTTPYCRSYKDSFGPGDGSYSLAINTNILLLLGVCYVLICISLFKHEHLNLKQNSLKYILIAILSCVLIVLAWYVRDAFLKPYMNLFSLTKYFEVSELTEAFFIELLLIIFMISLALSKREKDTAFNFNIHSILIPVVYFTISTYINWRFHNFEPGESFKYLNEVGGNG